MENGSSIQKQTVPISKHPLEGPVIVKRKLLKNLPNT